MGRSPWDHNVSEVGARGSSGDLSAGRGVTRSVTISVPSQPVKLSQERKGHGSSLALAALELAEKEKELLESISSLPHSGEGPVTGLGRLLKMASVDRDFDGGSEIEGPGTSGEDRTVRIGEESGGSDGRLGGRGPDRAEGPCATARGPFDQELERGRPDAGEAAGYDRRNVQDDDGSADSGRQPAMITKEISEVTGSSPNASASSPRYQMRQIQGFVKDRKSHSSSPLASNDVDVAVRCGFRLEGASSELPGQAGDLTRRACVLAEVVVQRHFAGHPTMIFVGVLEGHGRDGREMAVDLGRFLPKTLEIEMTDLGLQRCSEDVIKLALVHACEVGHARLLKGGYDEGSGVTATFGLVAHDKAYLANVGKGRCVLVSERMLGQSVEFERVSSDVDATPSTPSELERISMCGGVVGRFEDEHGIPYGSLRVFREGSRTSPGVTSSRVLGNAEALACGVLPEPVVTECTLNPRNAFFIWGSEGLWDAIGDEDASRVVSQYAKRRISGLTSADVLSLYAQSASMSKKLGTQEAINDVAVVVVDLREHIVPSEAQRLSDEETSRLRAPRSNEEAYTRARDLKSVDEDFVPLEVTAAAFSRLETLCGLNKTKEIEFSDRTSSLTQMMRGGSGEIRLGNEALAERHSEILPGIRPIDSRDAFDRAEIAQGSLSARHGGLPIAPLSGFERASLEGWKIARSNDEQESSRGTSSAFVPSQAIGVPSTRAGRKVKAPARGLKDRVSIDDELRPIRKVGIRGVRSMTHLKLSDSLEEGVFSQQSQSLGIHDVWSLSERAFSPHSSEGRANSLLFEHASGFFHEGKVRRGVPASFKSPSNLRTSSDSSETLPRSWSRANSLEEDTNLGFEAPNSPMRHVNVVPMGSYRNLRRQRSSSVSNLTSLAEDGDGRHMQRKTSNSVHVVKDIHKFFN
mmetsp:Transcript_7218/g.19760  ORF Transcript_7218/g.19760 Transcript_7218/m.19760 type:complete len:921 (-) Transcript_7218:1833-4595(-)